jgi:hypothetical protein
MVSVAAVAVIAPAASAGNGQGAIEKLEPELKKSLPNMLRDSPNEELQTVVFLKEGTDAVSAASAMAVQGATVTSTYNTLGAIAVSLPVKSLLGVASSDRVDLICLEQEDRPASPARRFRDGLCDDLRPVDRHLACVDALHYGCEQGLGKRDLR